MKHLLLTVFLALSCLAGASDGDQAMIIDVRTLEEWNSGHLVSAQHLVLQDVAAGIEQLAPDKQQPIYLYCRSGNRAGKAQVIMQEMGYSNVVNAGGVEDASKLLDQEIVR